MQSIFNAFLKVKTLRYFFLFTIICIAVLSCFSTKAYFSNQNTYYPMGLRMAGESGLQHDWFSQTASPHAAFTLLVAFLRTLNLVWIGSVVLEIILTVCFLYGLYLFSTIIVEALTVSSAEMSITKEILTLFVATLIVTIGSGLVNPFARIVGLHSLDGLVLEGLAGQYIWGKYLQPSEFAVLVILAICLYHGGYWPIATVLLALVSIFHSSYVIHCGVIVAIVSTNYFLQNRWRTALLNAVLFGSLFLPCFFYILTFIQNQDALTQSNSILVHLRIPHHTIPSVWWDIKETFRSILMILAATIVFFKVRGVVRWIFVISVAYTLLSVAVLRLMPNDSLALLFPWRGSTYLVPLSTVILLVAATALIARIASQIMPLLSKALPMGIVALLLISVSYKALTLIRTSNQSKTEGQKLYQLIQESTDTTAQILIPAASADIWDNFRLGTLRAIFVDWKSHPYLAAEVLEWWRRVKLAEQFYSGDSTQQQTLCRQEQINYYVLPKTKQKQTGRIVGETEQYEFVQCGTG